MEQKNHKKSNDSANLSKKIDTQKILYKITSCNRFLTNKKKIKLIEYLLFELNFAHLCALVN